jgi:hypothetical protein
LEFYNVKLTVFLICGSFSLFQQAKCINKELKQHQNHRQLIIICIAAVFVFMLAAMSFCAALICVVTIILLLNRTGLMLPDQFNITALPLSWLLAFYLHQRSAIFSAAESI